MDAKNLEITYSFSRLSNGPLDKSSHFDSQDDLENAYIHSTSTSSPFYDGEVVTVSDSNNGNGGTAYVYQNYNGQTHLDPIILNSEFNCSIVSNAAKYIETSNEQALKITNKYADDSAQKIDTSSIVNLKFVGKCTTDDIGDRTSAFWASNPGDVWFISESFTGDSVQYEAYSHIICIAGPMSTGQTFHDHFSVLGPVTWHGKTINAYTQDECNTKYMYKENILDDVISQESNTLFGKLTNAVFSSLKTSKTEFNILRNIYGKSLVWNQLLKEGYLVDMGLPSGTLWASRNIDITQEDGFAASPFQYESSFFSWGNVDGHNPISTTTFDYDWGSVNSADPWYDGQVYGETNGNTLTGNIPVGEAFDAARKSLGAPWRMPTSVEFKELFDNSKFIDANGDEIDSSVTNKLVNVNGIVGIYLKSNRNGARLFFSCSGYGYGRVWGYRMSIGFYWSSTFADARLAQPLAFSSEGVYSQYNTNRYRGFTIRPVLTHKLTPETDGNGHKFIQYGDNITDLTRVFGAGNEPSTVEEFKEIFPADHYPYNPGEIISNKTEKLEMTGFNQWDEKWELGGYSFNTGKKSATSERIRNITPIPVSPSTNYYIKGSPGVRVAILFYDINKQFISYSDNSQSVIRTTPNNCYYMNFFSVQSTYNNDICINISNLDKNGTYEPYKHNDLLLNLTTLTGKLNGIGERVTVFPDGMSSAGNVYDELIVDENGNARMAIKRVGTVDLGTLTWDVNGQAFSTLINDIKPEQSANSITVPLLISTTYTRSTANAAWAASIDKSFGLNAHSIIFISDSAYSDAASFKAAMDGVMLNYELATPLVYTDLQYADGRPFNQLWFKTYENGLIYQNPQAPLSVPMNMDYEKPYDMPAEYICMDSFDALLDQLGNSMGGTWTKTYNEETQAYEFRFTASN